MLDVGPRRRAMRPPDTFILLVLALATEGLLGYPDRLYEAIGHPVTWMGRLIDLLDGASIARARPRTPRRTGAPSLVVLLARRDRRLAVPLALACGALGRSASCPLALAASTLFAQRSLFEHVERVADGPRRARASPAAGRRSRRSSGAIPKASTRPGSPAPPSRASPRISPTASSRRRSGSASAACRASPSTRRSTPPIR